MLVLLVLINLLSSQFSMGYSLQIPAKYNQRHEDNYNSNTQENPSNYGKETLHDHLSVGLAQVVPDSSVPVRRFSVETDHEKPSRAHKRTQTEGYPVYYPSPLHHLPSAPHHNYNHPPPKAVIDLDKIAEVLGPGLFPIPSMLALIPLTIPAIPLILWAEEYYEHQKANSTSHGQSSNSSSDSSSSSHSMIMHGTSKPDQSSNEGNSASSSASSSSAVGGHVNVTVPGAQVIAG